MDYSDRYVTLGIVILNSMTPACEHSVSTGGGGGGREATEL